MINSQGKDVLLVELERHIAQLIEGNLKKGDIKARLANSPDGIRQILAERVPDTIVVQNDQTAEIVKELSGEIESEVFVLDLPSPGQG